MAKIKHQFNINSLTKKYKCDVGKLIRYWKNEKNDFEISRCLGIDLLKIVQIRQEIAWLCEKERQKRMNPPGKR